MNALLRHWDYSSLAACVAVVWCVLMLRAPRGIFARRVGTVGALALIGMSLLGFCMAAGYDETARALRDWDHAANGVVVQPTLVMEAKLAPWLPLFCIALVQTFILIWIGAALELRRVWEREQEALTEARAVNHELRRAQSALAARSETLRQKNEVLCQSQRRAEEAVRSKSQFLANMSHELRTPLTAILGFAEMLRLHYETGDAPLDPGFEPARAVTTVMRNGEHLLELIDDILDYSKLEVGKMTAERIPVVTTRAVGEVLSLLRLRAKEKNLELSVVYQDRVPERIKTDPTRLRQILVNLVGNAIKFTDHGSVKIIVRYPDPAAHDPKIVFEVVDTGIGMEPATIAKLFKHFSQADESTTRKYGGTGLGLAISQRLAYLLGGDITVSSRIGHGSRFTATIAAGPLRNVELIDVKSEAELEGPLAKCDLGKPGTLSGRVLLCEDGPDNQRLISMLLRKAGLTVDVAENGRVGFDAVIDAEARDEAYDLVLTDMQMPDLDGYGMATLLRREGHALPIIAITAHALQGDRDKCLAAGCNDYLHKPIRREELLAKLEAWLVQPRVAKAT